MSEDEAEEKMVSVLKDATNSKQVAKKIIEMKKKPQYKQYLNDDDFIEKVCSLASVVKPLEEECLSELSIQDELLEEKKSLFYESMKLV